MGFKTRSCKWAFCIPQEQDPRVPSSRTACSWPGKPIYCQSCITEGVCGDSPSQRHLVPHGSVKKQLKNKICWQGIKKEKEEKPGWYENCTRASSAFPLPTNLSKEKYSNWENEDLELFSGQILCCCTLTEPLIKLFAALLSLNTRNIWSGSSEPLEQQWLPPNHQSVV